MKTKILLWFLFFCVVSPPLCAQQNQKLDSLNISYNQSAENSKKLSVIQELFLMYNRTNPQKSREFAQEQLALATQLKDTFHLFLGNYNMGVYHQYIGDKALVKTYNSAAQSLWENNENLKAYVVINSIRAKIHYANIEDEKAIEQLDKNLSLQDSLGISDIRTYANDLFLKAKIYQIQDNIEKALYYSQRAIKIYDSIGLQLNKADALKIIAGIDAQLGDIEVSMERKLEALNIYKSYKDKKNIMISISSVGIGHVLLDQRPLAKKYFEEMLAMAQEENLEDWQATAYDHLGGLEVEAGNFDEGIPYLEKGVAILRKNRNVYALGHGLLNLGNAYYDKENYYRAIQILDECISISEKNHTLYIAHKYRSASYEALGELKPALRDYKVFKTINDSVWNIQKSQQIEELRTQYDTEKKEQEIALQEQEITVLEQEASISNLQRILMAIGLLLSFIGFYALRQKMKRNKLEREKIDAELEFKKKELTTHALNLARKNETLENLKTKAQELKVNENSRAGYNQLIRTINFDLQDDNNWENFARYFEDVHKDFNSNVKSKYPQITSNELRLLALLKMNLTSKEIANILNISPEGIKKARYRLRKKLNITTEDSLQDLVLSL